MGQGIHDKKAGFIGASKVGVSLGKYLSQKGLHICGYYSRNYDSAREAADFVQTECFSEPGELVKICDILFLTVPDGMIQEVYGQICAWDIAGKCICHCSGALSSKIFSDISERGAYGYSIHPICAVSDKFHGFRDLEKAHFTIEGDGEYRDELVRLFQDYGNPTASISPEKKIQYHLAAVFASNLVEGLYEQAVQLMQECGLDKEFAGAALRPLFLGNAEKIGKQGVEQALTGPVERGDVTTVKKHLSVAQGDTREIYKNLSKILVEIAKRKNPERDYNKMDDLFV